MKNGFLLTALGIALVCLSVYAVAGAPTPPPESVGMKAKMPYPVYWQATAVHEGKLYCFGGISQDKVTGVINDCSYTQIYDPSTDNWTVGAPMTVPRRLSSAAVVNGKIHVTGGRDDIDALDAHEVYDPATNTWTTAKRTPSIVRGHSTVGVNGKLYLIAGNTGAYQKWVKIYDPATDAWASGMDMPIDRGGVAYGNAVFVPGVNRIVYVAGDKGATGASNYIGKSYAYDPTADAWDNTLSTPIKINQFSIACDTGTSKVYTFGGQYYNTDAAADMENPIPMVLDCNTWTWNDLDHIPMPSPSPADRRMGGAGFIGDKIYLAGGFTAGDILPLTDEYDPVADTWYQPNAPSAELRQGSHTNAIGTKIYSIGGWYDGGAQGQVIVYDTVTNEWSTTNAVDPHPRMSGVSGVWNGKIVLSGGDDGTTSLAGDTVLYDPATDTFTALPPDPISRSYAAGAVVGNVLFVFGGDDGGDPGTLANTTALDLNSQTWSTKADLPIAIEGATAQAFNGKIYIIGGFDNTAVPDNGIHDRVFIYDPVANTFTEGAAMPYATYLGASAVWGNYIIQDSGYHLYISEDDGNRYAEMSDFYQFYEPATDTWYSYPIRGWGRAYHGSAIVGNRLYSVLGVSWNFPVERLDILQINCPQAPTVYQAPLLLDQDPCARGIGVNWTADPSNWNDDGNVTRYYRVWRDDTPMTAGACAGLLPYGNCSCVDQTTSQNYTHSYAIEYINGLGCPTLSPDDSIQDSYFAPVINSGASVPCTPSVVLSTDSYISYQWYLDGALIPGSTEQYYTAVQAGLYTVQASESSGCSAFSEPFEVGNPPTPTVVGNTTGCSEEGLLLSTQPFSIYQWTKDGIDIPDATAQVLTVHSNGSYGVRVSSSLGCQGLSQTLAVTIQDSPVPAISGPQEGCNVVTLSTTFFQSYQWHINGVMIAGATAQSYQAMQSGQYTVKVAGANACIGTSPSFTVTIHSTPQPVVQGPNDGCIGIPVTLSTETFSTYQWRRNGVNIPSAISREFTALASGIYSVVVTDEFGCTATSPGHTLTFHAKPAPTITGQTSACEGTGAIIETQSFSFYQWRLNGSDIPGATNRGYTALSGGTYSVMVTDIYGCQGTSSELLVTIYPNPVPLIYASQSGCETMLSTDIYTSYQWMLDGASISGATDSSYTATRNGSYAVSVVDSNGCEGVSTPYPVASYPIPTIIVSPTTARTNNPYSLPSFILGSVEGITGQVVSLPITLSNSEASIFAAGFDIIYDPSFLSPDDIVTGTKHDYGVELPQTIKDLGFTSPVSMPALNMVRFGLVNLTSPTALPDGVVAYIRFRITGSWGTSSISNVCGAADADGNPVGTFCFNGIVTVSGPFVLCDGRAFLMQTQAFNSYQWVIDGYDIPDATEQSYLATQSGMYTVRVTDSSGCQGTSEPVNLTFLPLPTPTVSGPSSACIGGNATLTTQEYNSYQWVLDGIDIPGATGRDYIATQLGDYAVRVIDGNGCEATSIGFHVDFYLPEPLVSGPEHNICGEPWVILSTQGFSSYQWFYEGFPLTGANWQEYAAMASGTYSVQVLDANGCTGISPGKTVVIDDCLPEVSPYISLFPASLVKDDMSSTGYYLYFARVDSAYGYNLYEGSIGTWYSHAYAPGNRCEFSFADLGTGEMRAEITPSAGNHYYLVTAFSGVAEGPSGYRTGDIEIDPSQSSCAP